MTSCTCGLANHGRVMGPILICLYFHPLGISPVICPSWVDSSGESTWCSVVCSAVDFSGMLSAGALCVSAMVSREVYQGVV